MKLYLLYLKNQLYGVTNKKDYMIQFLSERNSNLFDVVTKKMDDDECMKYMSNNASLKLTEIILEDKNGSYAVIGTIKEEDELNYTCEKFVDTCNNFKLHFLHNVPFKKKFKSLLDDLTTISKVENYHPIIQIDSVKLFYYLFKETFLETSQFNLLKGEFENGEI
jgi:hypothetical protein